MNSGDIIGGRYRLERKIGQGGTGRIWLAQDSRLDRRVAIKFLFAPTAAHQARLAKRVSLEAKIAASIQHPNVIQIFDFGVHDANIPYIVMEALSGFTLGEAFDSTHTFTLDALIQILAEVLHGLSAVHDAGIVHRDLKPENIFLVKDARGKLSPKLLDFGISRSLEPETRASAVTTTEGMILGTPQYMSPEQARGDSRIDKRTDIYSFGTIMFEAFSGVVPFPANSTAELLVAVLQRTPPSLYELAPRIGRPLCAVVDKTLSKDRDKRYAHAAELLDALLAASREVPPGLDRRAPSFPPEAIKNRIQHRRVVDLSEDDEPPPKAAHAPVFGVATVPIPPETVQEPSIQRRGRRRSSERPSAPPSHGALPLPAAGELTARPQLALSRAAWLALVAFVAFGITLTAAFALFDRMREPEGSGMIVVQAPSPSPPVPPPAQPAAPDPPPAAAPVEPVALDEPTEPPKKQAGGRRRKQAATDPLQLMASRVAAAISKQKAGVIACLNQHADDLEGAPQLKVRLRIDERGEAKSAELSPEAISSKPVAACLKAAVIKMNFPKPDQPTTFNVPLLWRRK